MKTTWTTYRGHRLCISEDTVQLTVDDDVSCSGDAFLDGALNTVVLSTFDLKTLIEARALLTAARRPDEPSPSAENRPPDDRPQLNRDRMFSDASGMVWFFGRTLAVDARGHARVERPLATVAQDGLGDLRTTLSTSLANAVEAAARALAPLPCFCGTGWLRPHEHDALQHLAQQQHPQAPIDHRVTVMRCRVCLRWWTHEEVGDSHYSYRYTVRQFRPGQSQT